MTPRNLALGPRAVFALRPTEREAKARAHEAVSLGREHPGWSVTHAAREAGTTVGTIRRYAPDALDRLPSGRLRVRPADRGTRVMPVISAGVVYPEVAVVGSRQASMVGRHLSAVSTFLGTGDDRPLRAFVGKTVSGTLPDGRRLRFELESDPDVIAELGFGGELSDLIVES